jgi:hypothetical protein
MGEMTPDEFADFIENVKIQIAALVSATLVPALSVAGEKVPVVFPRAIIDRNSQAWASRLTSPRHIETITVDGDTGSEEVEQPIVHAYCIGYGGMERRPGGPIRTVSWNLRLTLDSYYQDIPGTDADNPEKNHAREINKVAHVLTTTQPLGIPGANKVTDFRERRGFASMGDTVLRESLGELWVELDPIGFPYRP